MTFCPDGTGHALDNTGDTDLVFMALIIYEVSAETQRTQSLGFGFFY